MEKQQTELELLREVLKDSEQCPACRYFIGHHGDCTIAYAIKHFA